MRCRTTDTAPLLELREVRVRYPGKAGGPVEPVAGISLRVWPGETLGLVGESGCGKTSLARAVLQLPPPTAGEVILEGQSLGRLPPRDLRSLRRHLQMVFQDPVASLNPGRTIAETVRMPLRVTGRTGGADPSTRVHDMLARVGLDPGRFADRYPAQLSGGQCQRVSIARALVNKPRLLVCDEPVSSLDVSVQAQILNLLDEMKQAYRLTLLFISHDLAVVRRISDRVAVMYLGRLCEIAPAERLYRAPVHPYTAALLEAIPGLDPGSRPRRKRLLAGDPPTHGAPPNGCRFHPRCPRASPRCVLEVPELRELGPEHTAACHHPLHGEP